jgi:senataxin
MFERLVILGYKRHMLNVQYRMHPTISLFPRKEFYDEKLSDAPIVRKKSYNKLFLEGKMYSSYSFINITKGKEKLGDGQSMKNMVEVAVISEIIKSLNKGQFLIFSLGMNHAFICVIMYFSFCSDSVHEDKEES